MFKSVLFQDNKTPLHKASENGKIDVCETLLKAGADVKAKDSVSVFYCVVACFCHYYYMRMHACIYGVL